MFDEPNEPPAERPSDPVDRAKEKFEEFRMHAEFAAVYEGPRKFEAQLRLALDPDLARDIQQRIARLAKSRTAPSPILPPPSVPEAAALLNFPKSHELPTNDYHIHRRPGEVMIVRWLEADEVETFYNRMQAHFDVALAQCRDEERQSHGWKRDPKTLAYLSALDAIDVRLSEVYLRDPIRQHNLFVLTTQTADELDILHLADYVMGVDPAEVVGHASAPPEAPTEQDRAWFFKLFSLRGMHEGVERMYFFTFLQKTEDTFGSD
jgi:hypothetical protein